MMIVFVVVTMNAGGPTIKATFDLVKLKETHDINLNYNQFVCWYKTKFNLIMSEHN